MRQLSYQPNNISPDQRLSAREANFFDTALRKKTRDAMYFFKRQNLFARNETTPVQRGAVNTP
jgi:hypothetical protein